MTDFTTISIDQMTELAIHWGTSGFWAAVTLVVGWTLAGWAERAVGGGLARVRVADAMLRGFFASLVRWGLLTVTGIAVLERLGVQTASLVTIVGAAGLAIGLALQGTLSNLAAGVMLLLFRPFRVGDSIEAGALAGKVGQVSLFHTQLVTGDNIQVVTPNSVVWSASIRNMTYFPTRKVDIAVPLSYDAPVDATIANLRALLAADPRIAAEPAPAVVLTKFAEKAVDVVVSIWVPVGDIGTIRSDLIAAIWRECKVGPSA
ncbi:MAG: mechanosensitive ion channel [Alphaproteobacteria bacterium]|nr:mechanosensitive ion channel [Alphaproteobacteria bacterium]